MNKIALLVLCFVLIGFNSYAKDFDYTLHGYCNPTNFKNKVIDDSDYIKVIPIDVFGKTTFITTSRTHEPLLGSDINHDIDSPSFEYAERYSEYYNAKRKTGISDKLIFLDDFIEPTFKNNSPKRTFRISVTSKLDIKFQGFKPAIEYRLRPNNSRSLEFIFWDRNLGDLGVIASGGPLLNYKIRF